MKTIFLKSFLAVIRSKNQATIICAACTEHKARSKAVALPCSHRYCHACVKQMIATSLEVGGNFPPRCCSQEIPFEKPTYQRILGKRLLRKSRNFIRKRKESETYCSSETCKELIAPSNVLYYGASCPCGQRTCIRCKKEMHRGQCKEVLSEEDLKFIRLATLLKWKRCPVCGAVVSRINGCDSIW